MFLFYLKIYIPTGINSKYVCRCLNTSVVSGFPLSTIKMIQYKFCIHTLHILILKVTKNHHCHQIQDVA